MTDVVPATVFQEAFRRGWELEETFRSGRFVFRWVGGSGGSCFDTEQEAVSWMGERLKAAGAFD